MSGMLEICRDRGSFYSRVVDIPQMAPIQPPIAGGADRAGRGRGGRWRSR